MRGATSLFITIAVVLVVVALYLFVGKTQLNKAIQTNQAQRDQLEKKQKELSKMEAAMPKLTQDLPVWRRQLALFKSAIPEKIDDQIFLGTLNAQLEQNGVQLQSIQVAQAGSWLKDVDEKTIADLGNAGLDVETMRKVQVAYYDIRLAGDFAKIITCFENMKHYGRLYTIDLVTSETGAGGGSVTEIVDPAKRPIMLSGAIFYGIPESYISVESMERVFQSRFAGPLARNVYRNVVQQSRTLVKDEPNKPQDAAPGKQAVQKGRKSTESTTTQGPGALQPAGQGV
jgi:hypothetical protein